MTLTKASADIGALEKTLLGASSFGRGSAALDNHGGGSAYGGRIRQHLSRAAAWGSTSYLYVTTHTILGDTQARAMNGIRLGR